MTRIPELTSLEQAILTGLAAGKRIHVIAAESFVPRLTIASHTRNLYDKLGARTSAHAVAIGYNLRLLTPPVADERHAPPPAAAPPTPDSPDVIARRREILVDALAYRRRAA